MFSLSSSKIILASFDILLFNAKAIEALSKIVNEFISFFLRQQNFLLKYDRKF